MSPRAAQVAAQLLATPADATPAQDLTDADVQVVVCALLERLGAHRSAALAIASLASMSIVAARMLRVPDVKATVAALMDMLTHASLVTRRNALLAIASLASVPIFAPRTLGSVQTQDLVTALEGSLNGADGAVTTAAARTLQLLLERRIFTRDALAPRMAAALRGDLSEHSAPGASAERYPAGTPIKRTVNATALSRSMNNHQAICAQVNTVMTHRKMMVTVMVTVMATMTMMKATVMATVMVAKLMTMMATVMVPKLTTMMMMMMATMKPTMTMMTLLGLRKMNMAMKTQSLCPHGLG